MNEALPPQYDYAPAPQRSNWPVTFGVLGIVFGVFGLLSAVMGIFSVAMSSAMFETMETASVATPPPPTPPPGVGGAAPATPPPPTVNPSEMFKGMSESVERWLPLTIVMQCLLLLLAILLLVGGIFLLNRKPVAAKLLTVWAYGKIVAGIGAAFAGFLMQQAQMKAMTEGISSAATSGGAAAPAGLPGGMDSMFTIIAGVSFFFGVIWVCILPVVFLIWFHRGVVKADIATWSPAAAPGVADAA